MNSRGVAGPGTPEPRFRATYRTGSDCMRDSDRLSNGSISVLVPAEQGVESPLSGAGFPDTDALYGLASNQDTVKPMLFTYSF